jgi:thiol-disulfide isomerase/thioredoxin
MKSLTLSILVLGIFAALASAQAMTGSTTMSGTSPGMASSSDESGMMAPADPMASQDMGYDALKGKGKLADPMMGRELRIAKSTGMKMLFKDMKSTQALAMENPTVLFFAADWCPSCQADLKDINANGSRLGSVDVVVVDYDKSADLKAKYGVTVQDSFVQIDATGKELAIWNGGGVDGILKNLKQSM